MKIGSAVREEKKKLHMRAFVACWLKIIPTIQMADSYVHYGGGSGTPGLLNRAFRWHPVTVVTG